MTLANSTIGHYETSCLAVDPEQVVYRSEPTSSTPFVAVLLGSRTVRLNRSMCRPRIEWASGVLHHTQFGLDHRGNPTRRRNIGHHGKGLLQEQENTESQLSPGPVTVDSKGPATTNGVPGPLLKTSWVLRRGSRLSPMLCAQTLPAPQEIEARSEEGQCDETPLESGGAELAAQQVGGCSDEPYAQKISLLPKRGLHGSRGQQKQTSI